MKHPCLICDLIAAKLNAEETFATGYLSGQLSRDNGSEPSFCSMHSARLEGVCESALAKMQDGDTVTTHN